MNSALKLFRKVCVSNRNWGRQQHNLPEDVLQLQATVRRYAEEKLRPIARQLDEEKTFPCKQIAQLGQMGMLAIGVSPDHGGCGLDLLALSVIVEELSMGCASTGAIVSIHNCLYTNLLERHGTDEQKEVFLRPFTHGRIGCFALSEPDAGSDVAAMRTTATEENDGFRLNGVKSWVTSGTVGEAAVIFATIDSKLKYKGITAFLVPLNSPGIQIGAAEETLGIRAAPCCDIRLQNVKVAKTNIVGELCGGFRIAMTQLEQARIGIASQALGIAQAALNAAVEYSVNRTAFRKTLNEFQAVKLRIADMCLRLEAARLLVHRAAATYDSGKKATKEASMAKAAASMAATAITHNAIQVFGGNGYVKSSPVERHFRDARVTEIYGGVTDIQKFIIADAIFDEYLEKQKK